MLGSVGIKSGVKARAQMEAFRNEAHPCVVDGSGTDDGGDGCSVGVCPGELEV